MLRLLKPVYKTIAQNPKKTIVTIVALGLYVLLAYTITGGLCVIRATVGIPCPACGITRAAVVLLRLDFAESLRMHPLLWLVPVGGIFTIYKYIRRGSDSVRWFSAVMWANIVAFFLLYAVRMVLYFPHTEPMTLNADSLLMRLAGLFI
jgi:hypothetical protein